MITSVESNTKIQSNSMHMELRVQLQLQGQLYVEQLQGQLYAAHVHQLHAAVSTLWYP